MECGGGALHPAGRLPALLRRERAGALRADPSRGLLLRRPRLGLRLRQVRAPDACVCVAGSVTLSDWCVQSGWRFCGTFALETAGGCCPCACYAAKRACMTDLLVTLQPAVAKPCSSRSGQPNPKFQSMDSNIPRISSSWLLAHCLYRSSCRTSFVVPARMMLQLHLRYVRQFHPCQGSHACDAGGSAGGKIS